MAGHPVPSGIYDDYGNQWYDDGTPAGFWADGNGLVVNRNDGSPTGQYATSMPYYGGGGGGGSLRTTTVNGPQGYGEYVLNDDGSLGNYIGNTQAPHVSVSVNTPIQSQQGRYTTQVDSDGSVTGEAGAVYQIDNYDGSIQVIHHPTKTVNPRDKNNDGLDDTTGFAVGVYKDESSPSGYYYPEADGTVVPVLPNGAPYHGSDMTPNKAATLHYFSSGGVEYAYDPATGESKAIGGRPTASSSSGGGTVRVSSGSSGGGSSSASEAAQISAAASQANAALSAQIERERMKQAADQFAQTFGLDQQKVAQAAQQFDYQKTKDAADQATQRGKITADFVANPNDLIARDYWLHSGLEPTGTPVNIFSGQVSGGPTTQGALNDVQSMQAAGGMASSAPPPPAPATPPPPGYAKGTAGYTTAPVFKTGEKGTEMIQNPSGAPIRVLNHQQTQQAMRMRFMPPPRGYAQGTMPGYAAGTDYATWDPYTAMSASDSSGAYNGYVSNPNGPAGLPSTYYDMSIYPAGGMVRGGYGGYTSAELGQGGTNFDLGQQIGVPMTAGQRSQVANVAAQDYATGTLGDRRAPAITGAQVNTILQPPAATQPTQPSPGATSVNAGNFPTTYNTANTAPAGTPIAGQTATSTGYHIDVATGRLVPNVATAAPPPAQAAVPVQQQAPAQQRPTTPPPPKPAAPPVNPTAVFMGSGPAYADTAANFPTHGPLTLTPPPPATATTTPPPGSTTTPPPTGTTGGTTTTPPPGTTTTTPPPAASNGATTPSAIAYDPSVYANLPALQYLKGLVSPQDFANLTSSPSSANGLGGALPAPNQLNYADLNYLKATDPTGYAVLVALFKARNRDLEQEMQYAQQRAPISNAQNTDTIST